MSTSWVFPCNFTEIIADFIIESWHNRRQHSWYFQQSETIHSFLKADTIDVNILGIFKKVKLFTLFCLTKWCDKRRHWDTEPCVYRDSEKRPFYKFINAKNWNMPLSCSTISETYFFFKFDTLIVFKCILFCLELKDRFRTHLKQCLFFRIC